MFALLQVLLQLLISTHVYGMSQLPKELRRNHVFPSSARQDVSQIRLLSHRWNTEILSFDAQLNRTIKWLHISKLIANISELGPDTLFHVYQLERSLRQIRNDSRKFNNTKQDIIMIEKLMYQILTNDNLEIRQFRELLSDTIIEELGLQTRIKHYPQLKLMQHIVDTTFTLSSMTESYAFGHRRTQIYQFVTNLHGMMTFAAIEARISSIKYNRYTQFGLFYLNWIIRFINTFSGIDTNVAICSIWDAVSDVMWIPDFIDSDITRFKLEYCGVFLYSVHSLILKDAFGNRTNYKPESLKLLLLKDKYLWSYDDLTVQFFMNYCNTQTIPIWIGFLIENRLRSAVQLYDQFMDYGTGSAVLIRHLFRFLHNKTAIVDLHREYVSV